MSQDLTYVVDKPWGFALLVFALLLPRLALRLREPAGLRIIGSRRLFAGYLGAVFVALVALLLAGPLHLRPWVEAIPVRSASELMAVSAGARYTFAALLAWLVAAYLAAPVAAWLATYSLANGLLLLAVCLPFALLVGLGSWLAWLHPERGLLFNIACSLVLVLAVAFGFAVGARMPLTLRARIASAA